MSQHFHGVGGAPGIGIGRTVRYVLDDPHTPVDPQESPEATMERFAAAQAAASKQFWQLATQFHADGRADEAGIFEFQAAMVEDDTLVDAITQRVHTAAEPLETALSAAIAHMRSVLAELDDPYLRERAADIDAVGRMLHAALRGTMNVLQDIPPDTVLVADDLTPAETAKLRHLPITGFATAYGGATGHTAILARSLGIPAAVGLGPDILALADQTPLILDGEHSLLIANPDPDELTAYQQRLTMHGVVQQQRRALRDLPGQTADGVSVALWANIGRPEEAELAREHGAEGIGLFRTEFLFLERSTPPDEHEQYAAYCRTLSIMDGRTVVVRTLDIGGDKPIPYLDMPAEANPFLGIRGLRLCRHRPDLFQTQLRALLRAAVHGDLWIMLPMVATVADLEWGSEQVAAAAVSLAAEGTPHRADVPLGIMVETPAAAMTADRLARKAAFVSVGSNDLTQYTMAADRGIAELFAAYPHDSLAVLRLIARTAQAAAQAGVPVGVCGELASVPEVAPLLVGLGVRELSMAPATIPLVKERLRDLTLGDMQASALQTLD